MQTNKAKEIIGVDHFECKNTKNYSLKKSDCKTKSMMILAKADRYDLNATVFVNSN